MSKAKKRQTAWDEEQFEELAGLFDQGFSDADIADILGGGITTKAVAVKRRREGLLRRDPWRAWTDEDLAKLAGLVAEGLTSEAIGRRMGRRTSAIAQKRHRLGIGRPNADASSMLAAILRGRGWTCTPPEGST
jgi:hypothetical protein